MRKLCLIKAVCFRAQHNYNTTVCRQTPGGDPYSCWFWATFQQGNPLWFQAPTTAERLTLWLKSCRQKWSMPARACHCQGIAHMACCVLVTISNTAWYGLTAIQNLTSGGWGKEETKLQNNIPLDSKANDIPKKCFSSENHPPLIKTKSALFRRNRKNRRERRKPSSKTTSPSIVE